MPRAMPNEPFYLIRREMPAELAHQNPKKLRSLSFQRRSSPSDITRTADDLLKTGATLGESGYKSLFLMGSEPVIFMTFGWHTIRHVRDLLKGGTAKT
jgi:hypothetical protein